MLELGVGELQLHIMGGIKLTLSQEGKIELQSSHFMAKYEIYCEQKGGLWAIRLIYSVWNAAL